MGKSIVVKIIEERLFPYGFKYVKYQDFRWQFRRELEEGWQEIVIQKDIWGGKSYRPEIRSSVQPGVLRLPGWSEELRYCSDVLEYRDEEEQKAVLHKICDVIIKYGLEKISRKTQLPERHIVTPEMNMRLYESNAQLTQSFLKRNELHGLSRNEVLPVLIRELEETFAKPYEQIHDKLIEIAAVYGNMILEIIGGSWSQRGIERQPFYISVSVLWIIISAWEKKEIEVLIRDFVDMLHTHKSWLKDCLIANGGRLPNIDGWSEADVIRVMKEPLEEIEGLQ